ncbi:site-specific integrase [Salinibacterium sp.]|uniref:tyrosine-type recombinase/integrase n=1 Tax=Salinibacterium sp. TaxID=1915057 RepID=UPI00286D1E43|nr:site-specific integrase [Salinibacterium sp.]
MAHVVTSERASGTTYTVRWRDGSRFRQRTFSVKREAERFASKVEDDIAVGNSTAPLIRNSKPFQQVAEASLTSASGRLKPRTLDRYVQVYRRHVFPYLGSRRIGSITSEDVERWIAELAVTPTARSGIPLHPSTVKHAFIAANKVFRYAIRHRLITHNPATGTELPRVQHDATFAPQFLSGAEVEALMAALADCTPDDVSVMVAAYCGLRLGEMQALRVGDVDVLRNWIKVQRTLVRTKAGWREDSPKSANFTRVVPMNARVVAALSAYLAEHSERHYPSARLWPGRNYAGGGDWRGGLNWDKRMDYESFYCRRFRAAAEAIGRPALRFHDLRHTAASLWAASGVPLEMVAAALGHAGT